MTTVFISYLQIDDGQRQRVRSFAEKLRACSINVILDQLYLDEHPGGPPEKWPKWSSDRAINTERVIIIGTEAWFRCFDGTENPGTGLGAACEAGNLRQRIYDSAYINDNIRIVLFEDADANFISFELKGYHHFYAERDFASIVKWLGGTLPAAPMASAPHLRSSTPNNLPRLQPFFGREKELAAICEALDPAARTWGTLIDGDGGMGKTSLAVRAAYDASPEHFDRIIFVSVKQQEQDDHKLRKLEGFALSSWLEMINEIARELELPEIMKASESDRARLLQTALKGRRVLLVLDNLETLNPAEQDQLFTFLQYLPGDCKALLTSRIFAGNRVLAMKLHELDQASALRMLEEIAKHNPRLAKLSEADFISLYKEAGGRPLLLRWVAGQVGSGHCTSIGDALAHLRSCPPGNDALSFIFDDLLTGFTAEEISILATLTFPAQPIPVEAIAEISDVPLDQSRVILKSLANRSLVVPDQEETAYALVPMVADFLRRKRPEAVAETGSRLEERAYALIVENGYSKHDRFPVLDAGWPTVAPALPLFVAGLNPRLQTVCDALRFFLEFTGRWDESIFLNQQAETKALAVGDHANAGWRAYWTGGVYFLRGQAGRVLACADRAATHWQTAQSGTRERSYAIRLRGLGHRLNKDYPAAIANYRESLDLLRTLSAESTDVSIALNDLSYVEKLSGDLAAAERDLREALRIARAVGYPEGVATYTGNLASRALERKDWPVAETLAREALSLSEKLGRQELIAEDCRRLAQALVRQRKPAEALSYARRAVDIYTRLGSPDLEAARAILAECEG